MMRAIYCVMLAMLFIGAAPLTAEAAKKPNVLWLISEDQGVEIGCYGYPGVETPNIDALARQGVLYRNAFTTAPVCSSSRSAFNTGMYQITIGSHNHRTMPDAMRPLPEGVRLVSHWLKDAGYFTANLKLLPPAIGFRGTGKNDYNFTLEQPAFDSEKWADLKANQPFFAQLNFQETHRTFHGEKKTDPASVILPPYYPDHPVAREDWARYLDDVMELDRKIGLVLKQLEADGLADDTIVIYFGDNGQAHVRGKQFCYDEGLHVPLIIRWAKNHPVPTNFKPGGVDERLIEAIDIAATTLDIAGVKKPAKMEGRVFLGERTEAAREYAFGARDRCGEAVFRMRTARDHRYRYIRNFTPDRPFLQQSMYKARQYPVWNLLKELDAQGKLNDVQKVLTAPTMPAEELYDIQADPHQVHNLAGDSKHAAVLARMHAAVEQWIERTGDTGAVMEPQELIDKMIADAQKQDAIVKQRAAKQKK